MKTSMDDLKIKILFRKPKNKYNPLKIIVKDCTYKKDYVDDMVKKLEKREIGSNEFKEELMEHFDRSKVFHDDPITISQTKEEKQNEETK